MQKLVDEQWALLAPLLEKSFVKTTKRGRPRVSDRLILDGILWILKTGAQWNELPDKYPPYQTCHRRFQEWVRSGVLAELLRVLAQDMEARGGISLEECFIDGTFSSAKKGELVLAKRNVVRAPSSWLSVTESLFRSPSVWKVLLHMKSPWWNERLPADLPQRLRDYW
jgi:transposase